MKILAHRANAAGPVPATENTRSAMRACLERGWGIETDIRRSADGRFYISHDPALVTAANEAAAICALWREFPRATIALNVKELGYEEALLTFLAKEGVLNQVFLFDMELIEPTPGKTAARYRQLSATAPIAARASDRNEPVERAIADASTNCIWVDEFERLWITREDAKALVESGKKIYAVSPELHGFSAGDRARRWSEFIEWGFHGVCTDFPAELEKHIQSNVSQGVTK